MDWVIYALKDPITNQTRYVGKTHHSPDKRLVQHVFAAYRPKTPVQSWIRSLLDLNAKPIMELLESGSAAGWSAAERRWIADLRESGADLLNKTSGGQGCPGFKKTPEQRAVHAESMRAQMARLTAEERSAIARLGSTRVDPEQRKIRFLKMVAAVTPEQRRNAGKRAMASLTAEQRREHARLGAIAMHANRTPEQHRAITAKTNAKLTPEQRSEARKNAHALKTPEQRSEIVKKAWLSRR